MKKQKNHINICVFQKICVPLQRFSRKALRNQASPQQRVSSLHSVCADFAPITSRSGAVGSSPGS